MFQVSPMVAVIDIRRKNADTSNIPAEDVDLPALMLPTGHTHEACHFRRTASSTPRTPAATRRYSDLGMQHAATGIDPAASPRDSSVPTKAELTHPDPGDPR
jgi:hypothetical protein